MLVMYLRHFAEMVGGSDDAFKMGLTFLDRTMQDGV